MCFLLFFSPSQKVGIPTGTHPVPRQKHSKTQEGKALGATDMGWWGLLTKAADHETKLPLSARCLGLQAKHKDHKFYVHDNPVPARDKMRFWVISAQDQLKNIYSGCDGETGKGQTMTLMGSLATRLPKLPHEPNLAASQRCQATLHEKNVLAGEERKMKRSE